MRTGSTQMSNHRGTENEMWNRKMLVACTTALVVFATCVVLTYWELLALAAGRK